MPQDLLVAQTIAGAVAEAVQNETQARRTASHLLWLVGSLTVGVVILAGGAWLPVASTVALWVSTGPLAGAVLLLARVMRGGGGTPDQIARYAVWPASQIVDEFRRVDPVYYQVNRLQQTSIIVIQVRRATRSASRAALLASTGLVLAASLALII